MEVYSPDGKWLVHEFDSMDDFTDSLVRHNYVREGRPSVEEALSRARFGWHEQMPDALRIVEATTEKLLRERLIEPAFQPTWDVTGAAVDVGRFVSGEPECMIDFPLTGVVGKPVITIVTCMSLGMVSEAEVLAQGRAVCALVMAIQATGRNVEIWSDNVTGFKREGNMHSRPWAWAHTVKVKVKGAHDVLDPARLMFALADYGMGRTLGDSIFPKLDGRVNSELELKWGRACHTGGAAADDPNPELYPEGALIMPKPESSFSQMLDCNAHLNEDDLWDGKWEVSEANLRATVDFVMTHMRKLGIIDE